MKKLLLILEIDQEEILIVHSEKLTHVNEDSEDINLVGKFSI